MTAYVYTGTLSDIGLGPLAGRSPVMRVRPERETFGPEGLVSAVPVDVPVDEVTGEFSMELIASGDLSPVVRYVIEVGRFEESFDGPRFHGIDTWSFHAPLGGGALADVAGGSTYTVWEGSTPPTQSMLWLYVDPTYDPASGDPLPVYTAPDGSTVEHGELVDWSA